MKKPYILLDIILLPLARLGRWIKFNLILNVLLSHRLPTSVRRLKLVIAVALVTFLATAIAPATLAPTMRAPAVIEGLCI